MVEMTLELGAALAGLSLAALATGGAVYAALYARRANTIAAQSAVSASKANDIARAANELALEANNQAKRSADAAEESTRHAKRSADEAEKSNSQAMAEHAAEAKRRQIATVAQAQSRRIEKVRLALSSIDTSINSALSLQGWAESSTGAGIRWRRDEFVKTARADLESWHTRLRVEESGIDDLAVSNVEHIASIHRRATVEITAMVQEHMGL